MHIISYSLVVFVVRLFLGAFLAFFLAAIAFAVTRMFIVIPTPTAALIIIGVGAGLGGAIGWINPDSPKWQILLILIVGVLGALGGGWGGMSYGGTVYVMGGMPGIPEFSGIVRGAAIGGNIPPLVIGLVRVLRHKEC